MHVDSSGNVTDICQNCAASREQQKVSVITDVTPHDVVTGHAEEKSPLSNQSRTSSNQSLECSQQKSSSETDIDRLDPIMDSVAQCQDTKMVVEPKASSRPNKKAQSQTDATVKLREIRQMEAKLRKWEEELKQREANVNNYGTDQRRLEDYLQKT